MSTQKKSRRKHIKFSDPGKIMDLVMSITDETCAHIQSKINTYLQEECEAELVFQIIVNRHRNEAFIETAGMDILAPKIKLKVTPKLESVLRSNREQIDLLVNYDQDIQEVVKTHIFQENPKMRMMMFSVVEEPFSVIYCVVQPKIQEEHVPQFLAECNLFVWPTMKKTIALENEIMLKKKCQVLLRAARLLISQVGSLDILLRICLDQAKLVSKAEHSSLLLIDVDRMDLYDAYFRIRRFPMDLGVAGQVIKSGNAINLEDAKEHPSFDPTIDSVPDVECRNLLCFPIRDPSGIIGVGLLINKIGEPYFNVVDVEVALSFSMYCGVCIVHSTVFRKIQEAHIRSALAKELVLYHMKVGESEVSHILDCSGYHYHPHLRSLHFNPRALPMRELPCYVLKMFTDLGFDTMFNIKKSKLARFILYVKRGYRDVPYHNWLHAFNVGQWAYAAITNFKLIKHGYFNELQAFMFLLAGFMHALDHRGVTSTFQIMGQTTLAALYTSEGSVMQRHHLAQALCLLNTEGCDILKELPRSDYDRALLLLRDYIVATDLSNYVKNQAEYNVIVDDFQKGNRLHTSVFGGLLMNCADLSDQLKEWASVKKTTIGLIAEYFKQTDYEQPSQVSLEGKIPLPDLSWDREKCLIPNMQIQFLSEICIPLFQLVGKIMPKLLAYIDVFQDHIEKWDGSKAVFAEVPTSAGASVLLSPELDGLIEFNIRQKELERIERERLEAEAAAAALAEALELEAEER